MLDPATFVIISLLVVILIVLVAQGFQLGRIARIIDQLSPKRNHQTASESSKQHPHPTAPSDFDRFLAEDPARQQLGKKEQAAAYRAWRKERGLTWSA